MICKCFFFLIVFLIVSSSEENDDLFFKKDLPLTWNVLVANRMRSSLWLYQTDPNTIKSLKCDILPHHITNFAQVLTLENFGDVLLTTEGCLDRALELLIRSNSSPEIFGDFLFKRRHWLKDTQWKKIFQLVSEIPTSQFLPYYLQILKSFDYLETMASFFRPSLAKVIINPLASYMVRFTPLYYILGKVDIYVNKKGDRAIDKTESTLYSQKLCFEFASILKINLSSDPVEYYLPVLEMYLQSTQYLQRALLDESEYFELGSWLRTTFLPSSPVVESFIIKNDLYRSAYLYYLPDLPLRSVNEMIKECAASTLSLFTSRNRLDLTTFLSTMPCTEITTVINLMSRFAPLSKEEVIASIPCIKPNQKDKLKTVTWEFPLLPSVVKLQDIKRVSTIVHMILYRLFQVSFDYITEATLSKCTTQECFLDKINEAMGDYCDAFGRVTTLVFQ